MESNCKQLQNHDRTSHLNYRVLVWVFSQQDFKGGGPDLDCHCIVQVRAGGGRLIPTARRNLTGTRAGGPASQRSQSSEGAVDCGKRFVLSSLWWFTPSSRPF